MPRLTITHCWLMLRRTMIRCKQVMMRWILPRRCRLFARRNNRDGWVGVGEEGEGRDIGGWNGYVCHRHDGHERDGHTHDIHERDGHEHDGHEHDAHRHDGHERDGHEHDAYKGRHYISAGPSPVPSRDNVDGGGVVYILLG